MRDDFQEESALISRLLQIGQQFRKFNNEDWSHLKNQEDFHKVLWLPQSEKHKVENLYCTGRDTAVYMASKLSEIDYDFASFPTLTSVVEGFKNSWVYNFDESVPVTAKLICDKNEVDLWSVNQMIILYNQQGRLLKVVKETLEILKTSNLYKRENGIPIMTMPTHSVTIGNITNSNVNTFSDNNQSQIQSYNEPKVFEEMKLAIQSSTLLPETKRSLIEATEKLAAGHKQGGFTQAYKDFMANASAHVTIFTAMLPTLASYLI